jgi:hypothetical protein
LEGAFVNAAVVAGISNVEGVGQIFGSTKHNMIPAVKTATTIVIELVEGSWVRRSEMNSDL